MNLKITFTTPVLGSQPGRDTPASDFVRKRTAEARPDLNITDEVEALPEEMAKGTTGFYRMPNGDPAVMNYQVKGLLKEAADVLNGTDNFKQLKSKIDNLVFVSPRIIPIQNFGTITYCERPLRAMTMQGPRTSLARSEQIQEGAWFECQIKIIDTPKCTLKKELIVKLLDYGTNKGFGQWRNSQAYGVFEYVLTD